MRRSGDGGSEGGKNEVAMFEGTPTECVAWLLSYFESMTRIVKGAREKSDDEWYDSVLDALGRSVYRVAVSPTGMVADAAERPAYLNATTRIKTGLELFDALSRSDV